MNIIMQLNHAPSLKEMETFLQGKHLISFKAPHSEEAYRWTESILRSQRYGKLKKKHKRIVKDFIEQITGYSRAQVTRLIHRFESRGCIRPQSVRRPRFPNKYTSVDHSFLAETDKAHGVLSGPATVEIFRREHELFGKEAYVRLKKISISHLYNLRKTTGYRSAVKHYEKTKPSRTPLGERVKPRPEGKPGFLRVDTVHQGDSDGEKGVYYINLVDESTQWEIVVSVEKISEQYLLPVLEMALMLFPFEIINFHADNGSEYINKRVSELLNKMQVRLTKSRPRRSGDNGLVESKNGAIIRKALGYAHIPQENARLINIWCLNYFNPYLNFHRPCAFPMETVNAKGKVVRTYPKDQYQTPYEKLKSLPDAHRYLKPNISFEKLDEQAYAISDNESAKLMQKQKERLFLSLKFPPPNLIQAHS